MSSLATALLWLAAGAVMMGVFLPERPVVVPEGGGAIFVFDITQSMNVTDVSLDGEPATRLALAKRAAQQALSRMPCGTALGTGIFAAHRTLVLTAPVEVCRHRNELKQAIDFIGPSMSWHGNSEVAKAYYAALRIAAADATRPAIVFLTDGHEAPPISPLHRPNFVPPPVKTTALIAGFGGDSLARIPKSDPTGRSLGLWGPDDVMQIDRYKTGRGGSTKGEAFVELDDGTKPDLRVGGTPGSEHLSSLREPYLKLLASETGANYVRVLNPDGLRTAIERTIVMPGWSSLNAQRLCAGIALALLAAYFLSQLPGRPSR